jgi:hypothetical protein
MAQEFTIKSPQIEDKINQLLPSQGGFQAGVDFSASTMVVPIVDLTESAEGSSLRQDLQTALSHNTANTFQVANTTTTIINTTGYFRCTCTVYYEQQAQDFSAASFIITDGTTDKIVQGFKAGSINKQHVFIQPYDFNFFLAAGDSFQISTNESDVIVTGSVRQIADINGNLTNP